MVENVAATTARQKEDVTQGEAASNELDQLSGDLNSTVKVFKLK